MLGLGDVRTLGSSLQVMQGGAVVRAHNGADWGDVCPYGVLQPSREEEQGGTLGRVLVCGVVNTPGGHAYAAPLCAYIYARNPTRP